MMLIPNLDINQLIGVLGIIIGFTGIVFSINYIISDINQIIKGYSNGTKNNRSN